MKSKLLAGILLSMGLIINGWAQLSAPNVENVYGGRISGIAAIPYKSDSTRVFISTESANSIFYADVYSNTSSPVFTRFYVMPGVDASAGYGAGVSLIAAHETSGNVYFCPDINQLLMSHPSSSTVSTVTAVNNISSLLIDGDYLFMSDNSSLRFGILDEYGNFTEDTNSGISLPYQSATLYIASDSILYVFYAGTEPEVLYFLDKYTSLTDTSVYEIIYPDVDSVDVVDSVWGIDTVYTDIYWKAFGVSPSGRLILAGENSIGKFIAYSDDDTTWTSFFTGLGGITGDNVDFNGTGDMYSVFCGSAYSDSLGEAGTWKNLGVPGGMETHPNDGYVLVDPVNDNIVYLTTDQGIGASTDGGSTIFEIDEGVEAVRVNDIDMTDDKNTGCVASKSGIRFVTDYQTSPNWSNAIFPMNDGSPYYSVAINQGVPDVVYVGNVRIYKTYDGGDSWERVFSPESAPYNFSSSGINAMAIEICPFDTNIVFAGFAELANSEDKGGLFFSADAGITWSQILLEASDFGPDVDVTDIVFNYEAPDTVAYVSVQYDLDYPQGYSVYRVVKENDTTWIGSQDMGPSGTSTGSVIVVSINDLEVSSTGDTIFAAGTDAGTNHPVVYYKPLNTTGLWTPITLDGFPSETNMEASAIELGPDTLYCAVNNNIFYYAFSDSGWTLGYSYPVGTQINVLFYDDLLVGTSLGLYAHTAAAPASVADNGHLPETFELKHNYPNPFNPGTVISYTIPAESHVTVTIYNLLGKKVATLIDQKQPAGVHNVFFNASDLPSGIYFYSVKAGDKTRTGKMMLLK